MSQEIVLHKGDAVCTVLRGDNLYTHLINIGWVERVAPSSGNKPSRVHRNIEEPDNGPQVQPVVFPTLTMSNTKDEILGTMSGLGIPARPDMTKEALLEVYNGHANL